MSDDELEFKIRCEPIVCPCCRSRLILDRMRMLRADDTIEIAEMRFVDSMEVDSDVYAKVTDVAEQLLELRRRANG